MSWRRRAARLRARPCDWPWLKADCFFLTDPLLSPVDLVVLISGGGFFAGRGPAAGGTELVPVEAASVDQVALSQGWSVIERELIRELAAWSEAGRPGPPTLDWWCVPPMTGPMVGPIS